MIVQSNWQNQTHQKWRFISLGGADVGFFQILSVNSGKVLTVNAAEPNIFQLDWTATENQKWTVIPLADGRHKIKNKQSNLFLTSANINLETTIDQTADVNNETQEWFIVESF